METNQGEIVERRCQIGFQARHQEPSQEPESGLFAALMASAYRRNSQNRIRDCREAATRLNAASIDDADLAKLAGKAKSRGKRPAGLFAHWIDHVDEALKELGKR